MLDAFLVILVMVIPSITAIRAYRKGYQAGMRDSRTRELIRNRYSRPAKNKNDL